jgi:hypothetical protein
MAVLAMRATAEIIPTIINLFSIAPSIKARQREDAHLKVDVLIVLGTHFRCPLSNMLREERDLGVGLNRIEGSTCTEQVDYEVLGIHIYYS